MPRQGGGASFDPQIASRIAGPALAALLAAWLGFRDGVALETGALTFLALVAGEILAGRRSHFAEILPLVGALQRAAPAAAGLLILVALRVVADLPRLSAENFVMVAALAAVSSVLFERLLRGMAGRRRTRIAVIGSQRLADSFGRELRVAHRTRYEIVGRITWDGDADAPGGEGEIPALGSLDELGAIVSEHSISLLLLSAEVPRLTVFEEVSRSCLHLPVRLTELSSFYEEIFGHVPVTEINAAWFQHIMHPNYRPGHSRAERAFDVVIAVAALIVAAPVLAVLALLIKRTGPVLFTQHRIGEGGQPFRIYKLRTMRTENVEAVWATADDPRITRIGRVLRRTHVDELPQLLNVLRGEMRIVGPRPEQPAFVEQLEHAIPFYQRRHLVKPGLTGWAQVRCGYAGSDVGSAWKVCHDLWYLKQRSLRLDFVIVLETLRTLVADPQYTAEPSSVSFILAPSVATIEAQPGHVPVQ